MNRSDLLQRISLAIRIPPPQLSKMLANAPYRYRHYTIEKRTGGLRDIYQPTAALKEVQRWIVRECLSALPISDAVYSYRSGLGIADQARSHITSNYFVRLDLVNFFPSIRGTFLRNYLNSARNSGKLELDDSAIDFIVWCLCRKDPDVGGLGGLALTIGAPSSPHISNAILFEFDNVVRNAAINMGGIYTRYADDLFVSARTKDVSSSLEKIIRGSLSRQLPFLAINESKVRKFSRRSRIKLCGINITPERKLSVGRGVKKLTRAKLDWAIKGLLSEAELKSLRGWISYIDSIEPGYVASIIERIGVERFGNIFDTNANQKI